MFQLPFFETNQAEELLLLKTHDCMFELLFYSLLDRVSFIYFYVFAITLSPCCIICTLLHCGDWFSFVSGYVADMPVLPMSVWID